MNTPRDIVPEPDRRKIREDLLAEDNIRARINDMLVLARESDDYDMTAFAQARHEAAYIGGLIGLTPPTISRFCISSPASDKLMDTLMKKDPDWRPHPSKATGVYIGLELFCRAALEILDDGGDAGAAALIDPKSPVPILAMAPEPADSPEGELAFRL